jgi:hypothetical protein
MAPEIGFNQLKNMLNKKKISVRLILIGIALLPFSLTAQVAKEVTMKYPASVVCRLYAIASKTNISVKKQTILADYFLQQDKQANKALVIGAQLPNVVNLYSINSSYLKKVLSPLEFNDYLFLTDKTTSQYIKVLKFRNELGLNNKQINDLLALANNIDNVQKNYNPNNDLLYDPTRYEGEQLIKILTEQQYKNYLPLLVAPWAKSDNQEAWVKLKRYGFINPADSDKVCKENMVYFLRANTTEAETNNSKLSGRLDSVRFTYFMFKPVCLMKLDMINGTLPRCQFTDILKSRKTLGLKDRQIDTLLTHISRLEQLRVAFKKQFPYVNYDAAPFEGKNIVSTLNPVQYDNYLKIKNINNAIVNAKKSWNRLKKYGLIKEDVDSVQLTKELIRYHWDILIANERFHNDDTPQNAEARTLSEKNKPLILKQLDTNVKTTATKDNSKKALAW